MTTRSIYNKLVRDRIPELIARSGKIFTSRIVADDTYLMELIQATAAVYNINFEELEKTREDKAEKRWGKEKVVLIAAIFLYIHIFSFVTFSISA